MGVKQKDKTGHFVKLFSVCAARRKAVSCSLTKKLWSPLVMKSQPFNEVYEILKLTSIFSKSEKLSLLLKQPSCDIFLNEFVRCVGQKNGL